MKGTLLLLVAALVTACAGKPERAEVTPVTSIPEQGGWFCQMSPDGDGWTCVRDPGLAEDPRPDRIPEPAPPPEPVSPPDPLPPPTGVPEPVPAGGPGEIPAEGAARTTPDATLETSAEPPARAPPQPTEVSLTRAPQRPALPTGLPEYARLAYRPDRPMALTELPADFYAVQLLAMSSKTALEAFVDRQGIQGMSAARVERDGELFYVLLLGVYESRAIAQQALASLPGPIEGSAPWIRPLGSLQAAMLRADRLAGSTHY